MRVNREEFIRCLSSVSPGLGVREIVVQATCYVFIEGMIRTFNDEIACSIKSPVDVEGAVAAKPLLELLGKLPEDEIEVTVDEKGLRIKGSGRRACIVMEKEVVLPVDSIEMPDESDWHDIDSEFPEAISTAAQCASGDVGGSFELTCVHLHPDFVEGCDNFQIVRYPIKTGLNRSYLLRRQSASEIVGLGMNQMAVNDSWIHFRNPSGLILHCRVHLDQYNDFTSFFEVDGAKATLPAGLVEAIDKAQVFSCDNPIENQIKVELKKNKLRLRGEGTNGWFEEKRTIVYDGPEFAFMIAPKLLTELINRTTECVIARGRMKMDVGKFTYVACLAEVEDE